MMFRFLVLVCSVALVRCGPVDQGVAENLVSVLTECVDKETTLCLKEKAFKITERLNVAKELNFIEGISLVNTGSARSSRSLEPLSEDQKTRESQLESRIVDNLGDFLSSHVLQIRLSEPEAEDRSLTEEARGKKKKKLKQLLPILLLLKLKLAALIPLFLGIIAFVAVKAVFLGKIAFAMNAVNLIRKLLAKNGSGGHMGYSNHHHDEHPGYNYEPAAQGWSKRSADAQSLAYSAHA